MTLVNIHFIPNCEYLLYHAQYAMGLASDKRAWGNGLVDTSGGGNGPEEMFLVQQHFEDRQAINPPYSKPKMHNINQVLSCLLPYT